MLLTNLGAAGRVLPPVVRRGEPVAGGRTSGGLDLWCYLPKRAGLSKVTRQAAQRRRNPVEDGVLASCMAEPCQNLVAGQRRYRPLTLTLSRKGRGDGYRGRLRFANRPYWRSRANTLLQGKDVTDPLTLTLSRKGRGDGYRGRLRFANRPYAKVATAPDCRYQIAPLTIDLGKGVNRRPSPYYGARVVLSMDLMG